MLIRLYSIYDRVAHVFGDPFTSVNDATASRAFGFSQSSPESMLSLCPSDYQLWYLGSLDNTSGDILCCDDYEPYKVADGQPREVFKDEQ